MKQIITQHGWGLNKYFWDDYKVDFLKNNWHWQDNERGYFSTNNYQAKWIKSESKKEIRMTLCHSFGFHLMPKKILKEANIKLDTTVMPFIIRGVKLWGINSVNASTKRRHFIWNEATHIVLINSFNNFLPLSNKRNFILRSLKRMETKIIKDEPKDMLKEFIHRSFMPNHMNNSFKNIFYKSLESLNKTLLLSDLKQLYINRDFPVFLRKYCKIIFKKRH